MNRLLLLFSALILLLAAGCDEPVYTPKPRGFFNIDMPEPHYVPFDSTCPFRFEISTLAQVIPYDGQGAGSQCWFNLSYPEYQAMVYLTYEPLKGNLKEYLDDAYAMAYGHAQKSNGITQTTVADPEGKVYGVVYDIEGDPATPYQFFLTDSTHHFFRGSLYFNYRPNYDSLNQVVTFLKKDVDHLVETFRWK